MIYTVEKHGVETLYTESEYVIYLQERVRGLEAERDWRAHGARSSHEAIASFRARVKDYDARIHKATIELSRMSEALLCSRDVRDSIIAKHSDMVCDILAGKGEQSR